MCDRHPMEMVKGKQVTVPGENGGSVKYTIPPFEAPRQTSANSFHTPTSRVSNGLGTDRELVRHIKKVSMEEAQLTHGTRVLYAMEGIQPDSMKSQSLESPPADVPSRHMPKITLESLSPTEVHRRTGFRDLKHLLSYTAIVYGGDLNEMVKTQTSLTFLEEIVLGTSLRMDALTTDGLIGVQSTEQM